MSYFLPPLILCALLMPLEAGLLPHLSLPLGGRVEFPLCAVVLLAAGEASTLEGAVGCFGFGLLADFNYQIHPGLFTLSALLLFIGLRLGPFGRDVRGPIGFALLAAVAVPAQTALVFALLWLVGRPLPESPWWSVAWGALFTGAGAPLFYWLAGLLGQAFTREDPSLLR